MIFNKLLGWLQPHGGYGPKRKKRKIFTDLRLVKCYPCKCHDFVNQFKLLTIQLNYIFSVEQLKCCYTIIAVIFRMTNPIFRIC